MVTDWCDIIGTAWEQLEFSLPRKHSSLCRGSVCNDHPYVAKT